MVVLFELFQRLPSALYLFSNFFRLNTNWLLYERSVNRCYMKKKAKTAIWLKETFLIRKMYQCYSTHSPITSIHRTTYIGPLLSLIVVQSTLHQVHLLVNAAVIIHSPLQYTHAVGEILQRLPSGLSHIHTCTNHITLLYMPLDYSQIGALWN